MNAPMITIDGYETVPPNDEHALTKAVANQPVAIAMDAGGRDLQFYAEVSFSLTMNDIRFVSRTVKSQVLNPN